jgi:predicted permease
VSPIALILVGIRLQSQSSESFWASWKPSLVAALIKVVGLPLSMGLLLKLFVLPKGAVLGMVLQGGMPTALAGIILAETYELPQAQIIALTIAFSSVGMLLTIPVWLWLFG